MKEPLRVLVTGGAGFIGSHIVDALAQAGCFVAVFDDMSSGSTANVAAGVPVYEGDVCDLARVRQVLDEVRPNALCHQAAHISVSRSVREPAFDAHCNIVGLLQFVQEGLQVGVSRVVFSASGGTLYGDVSSPAPETHPGSPTSPYGIAKWAGEKYLEFFTRQYGVETVALRYANVYGPRQNPHGEAGVVSIFCTRLLAGQPTVINGDGEYIRDYVYVSDVARANLSALTMELPSRSIALNIGTSVGTSVTRLEATLRKNLQQLLGKPLPVPGFGPARAGDLRSSLLAIAKAEQTLGWRPEVDLAEGLARTAKWFAEQHKPAS